MKPVCLLKYRHRLHFFPALLPLVEIVPLLLAAVGAIATASGAIWHRRRAVVCLAAAVVILSLGGIGIAIYMRTPDSALRYDGTRDISPENYDRLVLLSAPKAAGDMPPPMDNFDEVYFSAVDTPILATPAVVAGQLVLGTYKNTAEGFDILTGEKLWQLPQREPVFTIGAGGGNTVYVAEGLHHTRAAMISKITLPDARIEWQRQFLGHIESPPALNETGDRIFMPAGDGGLWALRADDGGVIWHAPIGHTDATPLLAGGVIYAAAQPDPTVAQSVFYALDADTGAVKWRVKLPGQPWGAPMMNHDGTAIITTTGRGQIGVKRDNDAGWAMALSPADGRLLWQRDLADMAIDPGAYLPDGDLAIFTLKSGKIIALEGRTGTVKWEETVGAEFMASAIVIERGAGKPPLVAATTSDGVFTLRDAKSGQQLRRRSVLSGASSAPVVAGDRIYVTTPYRIYVYGGLGSL